MKSRVSLQNCQSYNEASLYSAIKEAVQAIGGFGAFFKKGDRVLLKPNILSSRPPEYGVNTHPEFIRQVVRLVRENGGIPLIGDSPGGTVRDAMTVYETSGVKKIAQEEGVELVKFDKSVMINGIPIAEELKKAACVINLPKAKTHNLTMITGAVKNMFGAIPGLTKLEYHLNATNPADFAEVLIEIFKSAKPSLSIMDAVVAMEGEGPAQGRLRNLGLILASKDAVALDAIFCRVIDLNPAFVDMLKFAQLKELGNILFSDIEVVGEDVEKHIQRNFKLPQSSLLRKIPSKTLKPITKHFKIWTKIDYNKCIRCMLCVESCPAKTIVVEKERPRIIYEGCISCMCCMEICPASAISIKKSFLAKIFTLGWKF